jgi:hypothetical protein
VRVPPLCGVIAAFSAIRDKSIIEWRGFAGIAMRFDLVSPLPLRECVRRLRAATDGIWAIGGSKPVQGTVRDTSIRLRKRIDYRNSMQCWLSATCVEDNGRTRLSCVVGLHPFVHRFLEIWIGAVLVISGAVLAKMIRLWLGAGLLPQDLWLGVGFPLVMAVFAALLLWFGDYLVRDEPEFLVEFLERTIDAREDNAA